MFSTFPQFVDDELYRRRDVQRDGTPAGIQKPKSPWMRMMSNYKENSESNRKILMGGDLQMGEKLKFGFENLYEQTSGTGERYRPKPAITSIKVDEKLESFECSVEWTAHSIGQLNTLFPYFMNLGTSVIVDWGWNTVPPNGIINPDNKAQIRKQFSSVSGDSSNENVSSANEGIKPKGVSRFDHPKYARFKKAEGRYSFVAGAITDFSYAPDGNGSYSCTTEIMSLSKAMEKLRTENQENPRQPESEEKRKPYLYQWIQNAEGYMNHLKEKASETDNIVEVKQGSSTDLNYLESGFSDHGYYISWGEIEKLVNTYASLVKGETSSGPHGEIRTFKLDSSDSVISSFVAKKESENSPPIQLRSIDPLTCIVDVGGQSDMFRNFTKQTDTIGKKLDDEFSINKDTQGYLYNLYVEYQLVVVAFETNETIFEALKYILEKCSAACFRIWNFDLVIDSNIVRVVDRNMPRNSADSVLSAQEEGDEFTFRPNTQVSIMRDFSFDTNLDDKMKGQVVAQRNANLSGPNKDAAQNAKNDTTVKIFDAEFEGSDSIIGGIKKSGNADKQEKSQSAEKANYLTRQLKNVNVEAENDNIEFPMEDYEEARKGFQNTNALTGQKYKHLIYAGQYEGKSLARKFEEYLQASTGQFSPVNANNLINVDASITLDGIGGFSAYQVVNIEQIPRIFENNGVFTIESVTHNVSIDDWTTELKTMFIVSNMQKKE